MDTELLECDINNNHNETDKLSEYLYNRCPDITKIFGGTQKKYEIKQIISEYLKGRYIPIKGHVQSGKTNFMISTSMMCLTAGFSSVIVLRNIKADRDQIYGRLTEFQTQIKNQYNQSFCILKNTGKISKKDKPRIYLALGNYSSTEKISNYFEENTDQPFVLFIDEVDYVDSREGSQKSEMIPMLKEKAHCVFGVSATIMDPLGKETGICPRDLILLNTPSNYKGISRIQFREIEEKAVFCGKSDRDLYDSDEGLESFIDEFSSLSPITYGDGWTHPNICLVNICRTRDPCYQVQIRIGQTHPMLTTIVYNGDGITYRKGQEMEHYTGTISSFLQRLKDEGVNQHPNILIFSGDLAGRGISFVSTDYKWHLTQERLVVSKDCDEPELIQKVRLCGIYNDDIPLILYSTEKILKDLTKAHYRQEEILCELKNANDNFQGDCKKFIEMLPINRRKFSSRKMVKDNRSKMLLNRVHDDIGWDISVYEKTARPPNQYYECYGQVIPDEEEEIEEEEKEEEEEEEEEGTIVYVGLSDVSAQTKETYELVIEFFEEQYRNGSWTQRKTISSYLQENGHGDVNQINARFEHLIAKGKKNAISSGLAFKKSENRWNVKKL